MVPSPPLWAVLGDVLLCLGAGLLLGAVRDGATLAFGSGPVRCFVWDVLAFAAAAFVCCGFAAGGFGYRGGALVYGRRHGAGGHCAGGGAFPTRCTGRCAARCLFWSGRCALRRTMRYTRSNSGCWPGSERFGTPGGTTHKIHARKAEKGLKKKKKLFLFTKKKKEGGKKKKKKKKMGLPRAGARRHRADGQERTRRLQCRTGTEQNLRPAAGVAGAALKEEVKSGSAVH